MFFYFQSSANFWNKVLASFGSFELFLSEEWLHFRSWLCSLSDIMAQAPAGNHLTFKSKTLRLHTSDDLFWEPAIILLCWALLAPCPFKNLYFLWFWYVSAKHLTGSIPPCIPFSLLCTFSDAHCSPQLFNCSSLEQCLWDSRGSTLISALGSPKQSHLKFG